MEFSMKGRAPFMFTNTNPCAEQPQGKNTFLEKINPTSTRPIQVGNKPSDMRWALNVACALMGETAKAIGRATPSSAYDALSIPAGILGGLGTTGIGLWKGVTQGKALIGAASTLALPAIVLGWASIFHVKHHTLRKAQHNATGAGSLPMAREAQELSFAPKRIIAEAADQLCNETAHLPRHFVAAMAQEVALGNWQVNHAYDKLNAQSQSFKDIYCELRAHLPLSQCIALEHDLQEQDFKAVAPALSALPPELQKSITQTFETRLIRNLTCFASRAIREQRESPTDFERTLMDQWLKDYAALHPEIDLQLNPKDVVRLCRRSMDQFATKNLMPLLRITIDQTTANGPSRLPKQLERSWMQNLQAEHDYKIHGIEKLPAQGRAIVAFNHSLYTYDIAMGLEGIREGIQREPTMVVDVALINLPLIGPTLFGAGLRAGDRSSFLDLATDERILGVAPGGALEARRPLSQANQLRWGKAKGFVRASAVSGAPIHTAFSPQADQLRKNTLSKKVRAFDEFIYKTFKLSVVAAALAPTEKEKIRVDHFISDAHEAPPLPVNNLHHQDPRFLHHVDQRHQQIQSHAQTFFDTCDNQVRRETPDGSYPMAT